MHEGGELTFKNLYGPGATVGTLHHFLGFIGSEALGATGPVQNVPP
jgi:hypothetical protein